MSLTVTASLWPFLIGQEFLIILYCGPDDMENLQSSAHNYNMITTHYTPINKTTYHLLEIWLFIVIVLEVLLFSFFISLLLYNKMSLMKVTKYFSWTCVFIVAPAEMENFFLQSITACCFHRTMFPDDTRNINVESPVNTATPSLQS